MFMVLSSTGVAHLLRRHPSLSWIAASLPCWAMASAAPLLMYVALALVMTGLIMGLRPLLSRSHRKGVSPIPSLANGPLIEVPVRVYEFTRGRKFLNHGTFVPLPTPLPVHVIFDEATRKSGPLYPGRVENWRGGP